jgi:hypothetical protein
MATTTINGIALKFTFFSAFAIIDVENGGAHNVILYDPDDKTMIRTLRRTVKVGDLISCEGTWETIKTNTSSFRPSQRLRASSAPECVKMRAVDGGELQSLRQATFGIERRPKKRRKIAAPNKTTPTTTTTTTTTTATSTSTSAGKSMGHSSKMNPRERGSIFVKFILSKIGKEKLNQGTGVVDVAGGGGHVSMAFSLAGVKSTVVDPRDSCGILPKRDRKVYRRAMKKDAMVIKYDTHRAYFGGKVDGSDVAYSGGGESMSIPACGTSKDEGKSKILMDECSLVCAMHPDEATEPSINWAIEKKRPFFLVPCCVFSRLFPQRRSSDGRSVETPADFVKYLLEKHPGTKLATLDIDGANQCVYWTGT